MDGSTGTTREPLLTEAERTELHAKGYTVTYPAGTIVIHQGDPSDFVLYMSEGWAKAVSATSGAIVEIHGPDSVIGELSALTGTQRSADIVTLTDVAALLIPGPVWRDFIESNARATYAHYSRLAHRFRDSDSARGESLTSSEHRVAKAILKLARSGMGATVDGDLVFDQITQKDIGAIAKLSRESVNAVLKRLSKNGLVSTGRKRLVVHDLTAVRRIVAGQEPAGWNGKE
ncbi:Crp/Fnr family transcriptional regulator [Glycomyces tarimensis]